MDLPLFSELPHPRLQWGAVLGATLVAAVTDLRSRRIPNLLTGALFLFGLAHAGLASGLSGAAAAVGASLLVAAPFVLLFVFAGGGAGDAKLMGAIGAALGLAQGLLVLVCTSLAGVVLAILWEARRGRLGRLPGSLAVAAQGLLGPLSPGRRPPPAELLELTADNSRKMPYGLAILSGAILAWLLVL
jgi:prepilin peptidase CpaA